MRDDLEFRLAVATLFALMLAVRGYYQLQSLQTGEAKKFESQGNAAVRSVAGLALLSVLGMYLIRPQWLAWASLSFPDWLRWVGGPLGLAGVALLFAVHRELGRN